MAQPNLCPTTAVHATHGIQGDASRARENLSSSCNYYLSTARLCKYYPLTSFQNFDVIGFDPRGVNNSRPLLTCFPNHLESAIYNLEEDAHGMIDTSDTSFDDLWASKRALAEGCSKRAMDEVSLSRR